MRLVLMAAAVAVTLAGGASASTIYYEDFAGQDGLGGFAGNSTNLGAADWSVDLGDAQLFNGDDVFSVVSKAFQLRDTNAGCPTARCGGATTAYSDLDFASWFSPIIDVTGFDNLVFGFDFLMSGVFETSGGINSEDEFLVRLYADGVLETSFDILDTFIDASGRVSETSLTLFSGASDSLQIQVVGNSYAGAEIITFDNLTVSGTPVSPVPLPATALLLLGALGGLRMLRRDR